MRGADRRGLHIGRDDVAVQVAALLFLTESYAPSILSRRAARLRRKTGNPNIRTEYDEPGTAGQRTFGPIFRRRLILPFVMLFTHPAVQAPSLSP